jgi:hypothetical protein
MNRIILLCCLLLAAGTGARAQTYNINSGNVNITANGTYTINGTGVATTNRIVVSSGVEANITLNNVNIDVSGTSRACAFLLNSGANVALTLDGASTLRSGQSRAGIQTAGAMLTIAGAGAGSLTANGGRYGAGIGGSDNDFYASDGGSIIINSGSITATSGGTLSGAGIGGGYQGGAGSITINGGMVTATGGGDAAGIGSGYRSGSGGSITISGGTVKASGTLGANDIGKGVHASGNVTLKFTGGSINATHGSIGATPTNGTDQVYLKTLTLPVAGESITAGVINSVTCDATNTPPTGGYGIKDVKTDETGKLHFWLPAADDNSPVELTADGNVYKGTIGNNATIKPPYAISLNKSGTQAFSQATYGYGDQSGQALDVTVTNEGYEATGDLTVAVNTAAAFDVSTPVSSIAAGATGSFTVTPKTGLSAGTYTATVTVSNDDVSPQTFNVSFTVTQRNISNAGITVTGSRIYTGTQLQPAFTVEDVGATITTADYTVSAWGTSTDAGTNGSVTIAGQGNYTGSKTQPFSIEKALLTVTAADTARLAGEPNPAFRLVYTGFVNGEDTTALTARPVAATTAVPASPAGTYPITVSGGTAANYDFSYVPGTLTVTLLTPSDAGLSFDLTTLPVTVTVPDNITGLGEITVRYNGRTTVPTEPGTYEITVDIAAGTTYAGATGLVVGTVTIPEPVYPPPTLREVILPSLPGVTTDPPAGSYYLPGGSDFVFTLTPAAAQAALTPVIKTGRTNDAGDGVEITPNGDGSYTVRIRQVRQPLTVTIDFTTAGATIDGARVWSYAGTLYITAAVDSEARIYSVSGGLAKSIPAAAGATVSAPLPAGFYVVVLGGKPYKVFVE